MAELSNQVIYTKTDLNRIVKLLNELIELYVYFDPEELDKVQSENHYVDYREKDEKFFVNKKG